MSPDDWQKIGELAGGLTAAGYIAYKAHRAEQQAKKAKEFSEPTGNGFAKGVKDALVQLQSATERIEARQVQSDAILYNHITAHANADVLKGARSEPPPDPNPF